MAHAKESAAILSANLFERQQKPNVNYAESLLATILAMSSMKVGCFTQIAYLEEGFLCLENSTQVITLL